MTQTMATSANVERTQRSLRRVTDPPPARLSLIFWRDRFRRSTTGTIRTAGSTT